MYARLQLVVFRGCSQAGLAAASTSSDMSSGLHCFLGHGDCKWVINQTESMMGGFCKQWCDFRRGFIVEKSEKTKIPFISLRAVQSYSYTFYWLPLISEFSVELVQRSLVGRGEPQWGSGSCSLTVSLWVKLSVVYFTFIVFGSVFSEGGEDSAGKQSPSHILNIIWNNLRLNIQVQLGLPDLWWLSCEAAYRSSSIRCPAAYDPFFSSASHCSAQLELNP